MNFSKAFALMKRGEKVKLPSWAGYWYWSKEKQTIIMHTKDGVDMDIRETQIPDYTFGNIATDEWVLADGKNCPELGGEALFSFSEAIKYLKRGMKVARKGWNGKKQSGSTGACRMDTPRYMAARSKLWKGRCTPRLAITSSGE